MEINRKEKIRMKKMEGDNLWDENEWGIDGDVNWTVLIPSNTFETSKVTTKSLFGACLWNK